MQKVFLQVEKKPLIIDLGTCYTKVGFCSESAPKKILSTPTKIFPQEKYQKNSLKINAFAINDLKQFAYDIQEYLYEIFFQHLVVNPKDREVILCSTFLVQKELVEIIAKTLFMNFQIQKIYIFFSNSLPLYISGELSGIVLDCGYHETQICPIYEGFAIMNSIKICQSSGFLLMNKLKSLILEENQKIDPLLLNKKLLENIKAKYMSILLRKQYEEFINNNEAIEQMKNCVVDYIFGYKQSIKISYYAMLQCSHCLFGNAENEEPNIAYSLLSSINSVYFEYQRIVIQNIILAGGLVMIPNFVRRLREEIIIFLNDAEKYPEFKCISNYKNLISFTNFEYPPNTLTFVGASMQGSIAGMEKFQVSQTDYMNNNQKLPDKFFQFYSAKIFM